MCSTPEPIIASCTPAAISAGGEVDGLLRGSALAIDGGAGRLDRQSLLKPGVAGDVQALLAELRDASCDHVLDLRRRRCPRAR